MRELILGTNAVCAHPGLLALSGLSTIFTWLSINVAHIRFRMAWKAQGHSVDELPFRALGGIWGSLFGATVLVLVLIAQVSFKTNWKAT